LHLGKAVEIGMVVMYKKKQRCKYRIPK